jgi:predicted homoserine dehydrogenase-like protein
MIIVDAALEKREREMRPIRVGLIGTGYMGRGIAHQLLKPPVGMRLAAIYNRTIAKAEGVMRCAGVDNFLRATSAAQLEDAVARGKHAVAEDPLLLCDAANIDVILDATSDIEFGARIAFRAIERGKHVVLNAAVDSTIGPILKTYADRQRVVLTYADGDEPGVAANLYRFVKGLGYLPVAAGNLKGLLDHYRTPQTQRAFAERIKQSPEMVTSYADGTKLAMECTILANATGLRIGKRGMYGPKCAHVRDAVSLFPPDKLLNGGLVDYLLGAEPGTGVFVIGYNEAPLNRDYMTYFKMGDGPFYVFYTPYHLPHLQVLSTIARAALFGDATVTPLGKPVADVLTLGKRDLKAGQTLDCIGGFDYYGQIDDAEVIQQEQLLPLALAQGCRLKRDVAKDQPLTYRDVEIPEGRLCDRLRAEQNEWFFGASDLREPRIPTGAGCS